jgi:hypothetical protein
VHQIKVRQPKGRKDSIQTVIQTSRRLDSFLYEEAQNFEVFSNIQKLNLKINPMIPLSCRSNLLDDILSSLCKIFLQLEKIQEI